MIRLSVITTLAVTLALVAPCLSATLNVKDFGAVADGKTDATAAIQKALQEAAKESGSVVFVPAGEYLIEGPLLITANSTLKGEYSGPGRQRGTIFQVKYGKNDPDGRACIEMQGGSELRNVAFMYPEQTPDVETPTPYSYTIQGGGDCRIEDVYLHNSYQGINLDSSHANMVRNVWGEPLRVGINADHIYDISRIENVHFWPYFTNGKPMRKFVQSQGVAFQFGRSDWQYCLNTFCYGYGTGYRFYKSEEIKEKGYPGGGTNGNFVGIGADCCRICVDVEESFHIGVSITNGEFAPFGGDNTRGVFLRETNTGNLTLTNCNFWAVTWNVAEVQGGSLNMNACNIENWAVVKKDAPAFILGNGRLNVNNCTFNKGGYLASLTGEKSRAIFANNMGTDEEFTVLNLIDEKVMFNGNNPSVKVVTEMAEPEEINL